MGRGRVPCEVGEHASQRQQIVEAETEVEVSLIGRDGLRFLPSQLSAELECWSIRDPYGEDDEVYLAVARELERRIGDLLADQEDRELPIV